MKKYTIKKQKGDVKNTYQINKIDSNCFELYVVNHIKRYNRKVLTFISMCRTYEEAVSDLDRCFGNVCKLKERMNNDSF